MQYEYVETTQEDGRSWGTEGQARLQRQDRPGFTNTILLSESFKCKLLTFPLAYSHEAGEANFYQGRALASVQGKEPILSFS